MTFLSWINDLGDLIDPLTLADFPEVPPEVLLSEVRTSAATMPSNWDGQEWVVVVDCAKPVWIVACEGSCDQCFSVLVTEQRDE